MEDEDSDLLKRFHWTAEETYALINVWSNKHLQRKLNTTSRNIDVYVYIAKELRRKHGICRTAIQCRQKVKKLKSSFKKAEEKGLGAGWQRQQECPFYDVLAPVLQWEWPDGPQLSPPPPRRSPPCYDDDFEDSSMTEEPMNQTSGREPPKQQQTLDLSSSHDNQTTPPLQSSAACEGADHGRVLIYQKDKLVSVLEENGDQPQSAAEHPAASSGGTQARDQSLSEEIGAHGVSIDPENDDVDQKPCLKLLNASIQRTLPTVSEDLAQASRTPSTRVSDQQDTRSSVQQPSTSTEGRRDAHIMPPSTSRQEDRRRRKRRACSDFVQDSADFQSLKDVSPDAALRSLKDMMEVSIRTFSEAANKRLDMLLQLERRRQKNEHKQVRAMLSLVSRVCGRLNSRQPRRRGADEEEEDEDEDEEGEVHDSENSLLGQSK